MIGDERSICFGTFDTVHKTFRYESHFMLRALACDLQWCFIAPEGVRKLKVFFDSPCVFAAGRKQTTISSRSVARRQREDMMMMMMTSAVAVLLSAVNISPGHCKREGHACIRQRRRSVSDIFKHLCVLVSEPP